MRITHFAAGAVIVGASFLVGPQDPVQLQREIAKLRQERDDLRVRVAQLEAWLQAVGINPSVPNPLGLPNGALVMQLEEVRPYHTSASDDERLIRMNAEVRRINERIKANREDYADEDTTGLERRRLIDEHKDLRLELLKAERDLTAWRDFLRQQY